jgi:hypothetical protein
LIVPTAAPQDLRRILVTQSLHPDQKQSLPLLGRELSESRAQVMEVKLCVLLGWHGEETGHRTLRVLHLPPALAVFGMEQIAQDGEEPSRKVDAGRGLVEAAERAHKRVLHPVIRVVDIVGQRDCKGA